jgi:hypothetical protein
MSQLNYFFILGLLSIQLFGQSQKFILNYQSELPFQTANDSDYFHLESTLLLRKITNDLFEIVKQQKATKTAIVFKLQFKSLTGAEVFVDYGLDPKALRKYLSTPDQQFALKEATYNWINRSFGSNIPYKR